MMGSRRSGRKSRSRENDILGKMGVEERIVGNSWKGMEREENRYGRSWKDLVNRVSNI